MVDVNSLIVPASKLKVIVAFDINDRGEIAGLGLLPSGDEHAVLLLPCDGITLTLRAAKMARGARPA
jgi:hypothetical protein